MTDLRDVIAWGMDAYASPGVSEDDVRRRVWRDILAQALVNAHPEDRATAACLVLDDLPPGSPFASIHSLDDLRGDADFWADCATPREVEVYFAAALKRLRDESLGIKARKRLFRALWESFTNTDRVAFLKAADPDGKVTKVPA